MTDTHVKQRPGVPASYFTAEAAGLAWLAEATATGGCAVAEVVSVSDNALVLTTVPAGRADRHAAAAFGRALARTHAAGASAYGAAPPGAHEGWIADLPLPYASWPTFGPFYAEARLAPYARAARDSGALGRAGSDVLDVLCAALWSDDPAVVGPPEPPSRLHGDLWSGNVLWSPSGAVLIDPAAHGGHRETDLAMLALFGLPHLDEALAAYDAEHPLAAGWRARVPLHQVHPLLVHAVLFGGSYGEQAIAAARRALGG
jgi:fructosamine-3-kinase